VLAEETGHVVFENFVIAENYHAGIEFYLANFTREPPLLNNSAVIGVSASNAHSNTTNYTSGMSAAITGRSGVTSFNDVRFYNFPAGSVLLQTCRLCDDPLKYTNLGTEVTLQKLTFSNVSGQLLFMIGLKRDVIYDLDGSLSQLFDNATRSAATIVHGWPHIAASNPSLCPPAAAPSRWDNAVMCAPSVSVRRVFFTNLMEPQLFSAQNIQAV
jgi:hypothetical protein